MTLSLFNLQTILVFYVDTNQEKQLQQKLEIFYWRRTVTWRKINSLWMLIKQNYFFSTSDELEPKITFNGNLIKSAESCRYLGIHLDSKLIFEAHLKVVLKNGGRHSLTISSKKPYNFGSKVASFQIFSPLSFVNQWCLFTNIVRNNVQRINRQINWGIKVC